MENKFWPLAKGSFTISSGFGPRDGGFHYGMDFAAKRRVPIYAPVDGFVVEGLERENVQGFGKWVWLDCQETWGIDFIVGHCDPMVRKNEIVHAGGLIGYVNSHGQSTGPHAHCEVWTRPGRIGGKAVDPAQWLKDAKYVGEIMEPTKGGSMSNPITRTMLSPNCHSGGRGVDWIGIHTQEGGRKAVDLATYCGNPAPGGDPNRAVSYNGVVDDVESILVVPWDMNPWSASNANSRADHICAAGSYAGWSRGKWLETDASDGKNEDLELTKLAQLTAWRCQVRGIPPEYVGNYGKGPFPPSKPGICGHMDFGPWGGGHHDPGVNFPWDEFIRRVKAFYNGGTMGFLDETFKNFQNNNVTIRTVLFFVDQKIEAIRAQVVDGWAQLGTNAEGKPLTLIDSQAIQNSKLDQIIELEKKILDLGQKTYELILAEKS